jgi:hypothetical protein
MTSTPELHPDAARLAFLLGTWRGDGKGEYPTIAPFAYREELRFWHNGKPFLAYSQRTWDPETKLPRHGEMGYWRPVASDRVEIVLAHPTGIVEIQEGTLDGTRIKVASTMVGTTATAKQVTTLERLFTVESDVMRYELRMAAVGQPLQHHLAAELLRVPKA